MVANMDGGRHADMEVDIMADIKVNMVADFELDMVADMEVDMVVHMELGLVAETLRYTCWPNFLEHLLSFASLFSFSAGSLCPEDFTVI